MLSLRTDLPDGQMKQSHRLPRLLCNLAMTYKKTCVPYADEYYNKNDLAGAKRRLEYWEKEANALNDFNGELSVINELLGLYRKKRNKIRYFFVKTFFCQDFLPHTGHFI